MRRSVLRVLGAAFLVLLPACGSDGGVVPPAALDGEYVLESVNGISLPFLKTETPSERVEVVSGSLTLRPNRTYSGEILERRTTGVATQFHSEASTGTYRMSGSALTFTVTLGQPRQGAEYFGTREGNRISATLMDVTFVFVERPQ